MDLSLYPLDTLKTRLQTRAGFAASGGFQGIYAGVGSALVGSAPSAALFFVTYDGAKRVIFDWLRRGAPQTAHLADGTAYQMHESSEHEDEAVVHMAAAALGEIAACTVRVPTEVVKQRAQASQHPSSLAALRSILTQRRTYGPGHVLRELYRGWSITLVREVPFTVVQFPLWEALKKWRCRTSGSSSVSGFEGGVLGSVAGAVAAGVTTPLDVLKTRLMLAAKRQSTLSMLGGVLSESGPRAFFAGIGPRVAWISAGGAVFLGSYQWAINVLSKVERG